MNVDYRVYQSTTNEFLNFKFVERDFSFGDYKEVYKGGLNGNELKTKDDVLDELYMVLNIAHPEDYKSRSLSIGDIVEVSCNGGEKQYFYCESMGWKEVTELCNNKDR